MKKIALFIAATTLFFQSVNAHANKFEECKAKLMKAQKLGVLHNLDWKPPKEPYVVAGRTFFSMPIDAKEGFAETVNCFLMGGEGGKCVNFNVLSWQTGKPVGRFAYCRFKMH